MVNCLNCSAFNIKGVKLVNFHNIRPKRCNFAVNYSYCLTIPQGTVLGLIFFSIYFYMVFNILDISNYST